MDNLNEREKQIIERREYRRRLAEDPSFVPYVGGFWSHDDRYRNDALKPTTDDKDQQPSSTPRFVSPQQPAEAPSQQQQQQQRRRYQHRNVHRKVPEEVLNQRWGHDGYEELMRMEELEEREGRKFSTLDEYYRSKRHGGNKQQYQSRNRRMKADIPDGAGASSQWQQAETIVQSFDQQWPTLETTDKEDTTANKGWGSTTNEDKENEQWGSTPTTTKEDEGWGSTTTAAKEDEGWGSTTTTTTKKDEGWSNIEQPQTTGWDPNNAAAEWKQRFDTKPRNDKGQQSKSKQPMSRGTNDTKKRPPASKKPVASNEKEEEGEEVEWKALASWDTKKVSNDVNWKSDAIAQDENIKANDDDSWNASVPWEEEENGAKSTTDNGWGDVNNQSADDGDDGWKKAADWGQSTGGWSSKSSGTANGWGGDSSSSSNKADGWGSSASGSWRKTDNKDRQQQSPRDQQRRGRGYLSQKKPLESTTTTTKSKPMSKHAKPFSPSQPIHTTPTLPPAAASEPTSAPENASSSVYAFATEPWQSSGSPRDDARGHERFIEDQEDQESDVEIILEADTSASASRSEVDTATPPRQRDLEGNWRRRDQQEPMVGGDEGDKDDMMATQAAQQAAAAQAAAAAAAMQQGIPYFYPPAMGGYMPMPPYPIPMPMTSASAGVPPSAMMPMVTSAAPTSVDAAPSPAPNATSTTTPPNGSTSTESPDNGSYMPSSFEANGMVYYSVNPSAMYPYYYYPAPMAMPMMAAPPPPPPPQAGADSPRQQGTNNSVDDGWGPEPDHSAQDSGWEHDKNSQQASSFNPPFHYYPSYS